MVSELFPVTMAGARTSRRGTVLVGPIDLTLEGRGTCVVIGPNGSGKTSFLRLLHGAARLTGGSITWACPMQEARRQQAFVFQRPVMLRRTVEQNLIYPLVIHGTSRLDARARAREWAEKVALDRMLDRQASILSGGEQQKLALARALISDPRLVFLDEPCSSLDGRATREIEDILQSAKARGTRLIMSTHDMGQARRLADQVVFLLRGKVHDQGDAPEFFDGPSTSQARAFLKGDIVE
ncbi:ATP-binding cassette domain-containing protein [Paracoccus saliphilus]|uniref:ATP-binding cassette domain-containing protein n=1 Tax=Paracoccus saliphilus TaxID=405559 RepID=A0AA46A731_9RHOB|nr:ATP-binding cassette domain-containing protein [Paracoccus saliphilus]WCR03081.1 ATP-binding cassette domain-containing protein [Paracoccus saliphilus]SIT07373.1 phosphate ABC transporter ATP-binding protein, PhoT family [Paracoccus saliphilus]